MAGSAVVAAASGLVIAVVAYIALFGIWQGSFRYDWMPLYNVSTMVAKQGGCALGAFLKLHIEQLETTGQLNDKKTMISDEVEIIRFLTISSEKVHFRVANHPQCNPINITLNPIERPSSS